MTDYEVHPVAALFPVLEGDALLELVGSVRSKGLLNPITVHNGLIIDGQNRKIACKLADVEPVYVEWAGEGDPSDWIVATNLHRRHLTASQRALIALELKKRYETQARERKVSGTGGPCQAGEDASLSDNTPRTSRTVPHGDEGGTFKGKASEQAARATGVSAKTIERAERFVATAAPELVEAVRTGDVTVRAALEVAKLPQEQQRETLKERKVKEKARALRQTSEPPTPSPPPPVPPLLDCSPLNIAEFLAAYRKGPSPNRRQPGHEAARLQQIAVTIMLADRAWTWITAEWDSDQREDMSFALNEAKEMTPLLKEFGRRLTAIIAKCSTEAADALRASAATADTFEAGVAAAPCEGVADKG